jgi:uncharacterized protein (DUF58 family)
VTLPLRSVAVAAGGAALIVVALAFDTSPLFVPGVAFLAIGVLTPAAVWGSAVGAEVRRLPGEREVTEGVRFKTTVLVRAGPLGLYGAQLHDPLCGSPVTISVSPPRVGGAEARVEIVASFPRRGRKRMDPPALRVADPLGLAPMFRRGSDRLELLVVPRTEPVDWSRRGASGNRHTPAHGLLADAFAASEVDGLRPYRPGTPASRIHWAALARGAGLLERRMRAEQESRPLIVLDSRCAEEAAQHLDMAVRAAASLVVDLARRGGCGLLTADGGRALEIDSRLAGWPAARTRLALIAPSRRAPALAAHRRPGQIFYVAAEPVGRPPQILLETGGMLVLPASVGAPEGCAVAFSVCGCVGYELRPRGGRGLAPSARGTAVLG